VVDLGHEFCGGFKGIAGVDVEPAADAGEAGTGFGRAAVVGGGCGAGGGAACGAPEESGDERGGGGDEEAFAGAVSKMIWRVVIRPEVERDVAEAARWYESRQAGLGAEFVEEVIRVWNALESGPLIQARRHPRKNIRWQYPERFPYRVVYEVSEAEHIVVVAAVLHASRDERHWRRRIGD